MVKIKLLIENNPSKGQPLEIEHGLSYYIETEQESFIFDFGHTDKSLHNAHSMGVDLQKVKKAIISHAHYDHAGGFPNFVKELNLETLYTGPGFWNEKYSYSMEKEEFKYLGCGFNADDLQHWNIEQKVVTDVEQIHEDIWIITSFPRKHQFETIPKRFVLGKTTQPDLFNDELALVVREGDGLAVIVACSHPGILNIIDRIHDYFHKPVYSVIGGTHLKEANEDRIVVTLKSLKALGLNRIGLCHCSGERVREMLLQDNLIGGSLSTGDEIIL